MEKYAATSVRPEDDVEGVSSCPVRRRDGRVVIQHAKAEEIFVLRLTNDDKAFLHDVRVGL